MVGASDFCEVFYTDVRIPLSNVVGDINDGWRVTMATLSFERGTAFISQQMKLHNTMEKLIEFARKTPGTNGRPMIEDDEIGRRLAEARAEVAALRSMTYATISRGMRSTLPGPEGSMVKLFFSELAQRIHHIGLEALGPRKVQLLGGDPRGENPDWVKGYLGSFAMTLGGGTSEIQRNIIGERFLGLPREPR